MLDVNHGDMLINMITNHTQDHPTMARLVSNTYGNITLMSKSKDDAIIELQKAASSKPKSAKQNFIDLHTWRQSDWDDLRNSQLFIPDLLPADKMIKTLSYAKFESKK